MNRTRIMWVATAAAALVVIALLAWQVRHRGPSAGELVASRARLTAEDPRVRYAAAGTLLAADVSDPEARLAYAGAMIDLGIFGRARETLLPLAEQIDSPHRVPALKLKATSFLAEASGILAESSPANFSLVSDKVEPLLSEAGGIVQALADAPAAGADLTVTRARLLDARADLMELQLKAFSGELNKARAIESDEQIHVAGVQVSDLRDKLKMTHEDLRQVCDKALIESPTDSRPRGLLFRLWLREGQVDKARQVAHLMIDQPAMDRRVAGRAADDLLNLDARYGRESTPADVKLADALLHHSHLINAPDILYRLALVELALRQGDAGKAQTLAQAVLDDYPGHIRTICLVSRARIAQGQSRDAIQQMATLNDRTTSGDVRYTLGMAYLRVGQGGPGREILRQALDIQPDLLPARLLLAESLVDDGFIVEAEPDILTALAMAPAHPGVMSLYARLLIAKSDANGLRALVERGRKAAQGSASTADLRAPEGRDFPDQSRAALARGLTPRGSDPGPAIDEVYLASAFLMDDVAAVQRLEKALRRDDAASIPGVIAAGWLAADARQRAMIATVLCLDAIERLDADPLARAVGLPIRVLDGPPIIGTQAGSSPRPGVAPGGADGSWARMRDPSALRRTCFVPWPQELGLEMLELAQERWPGDIQFIRDAVTCCLMLDRRTQAMVWLQRWPQDQLAPLRASVASFLEGGAVTRSLDDSSADEGHVLRDWMAMAWIIEQNQGRPTDPARAAMQAFLEEHPWNEQAILLPLRAAAQRDDTTAAQTWLLAGRQVNQQLSELAEARFDLALGRASDALHTAERMIGSEPGGSDLRVQAGEVRARIHLLQGNIEIAAGVFENLALSTTYRRDGLQLAIADVYLAAQRTPSVAASITTFLADPHSLPSRQDSLLARAAQVLPPQRIANLADSLLRYHPGEPILLVYKAQALIDQGDLQGAGAIMPRLVTYRPDAPRVMLLQARLAQAQGQVDQAMRTYQRLLELGGRSAAAAGADLQRQVGRPDGRTTER
ncbi:MAG: tetratricopeptide repeat protein [Phycisphaeraceae bacterium]